ncbi:MAG: magnesium transporter [Sedimentisphaerales bacterium]|nr:magnesium transporter [Sedimentisphaerales bacterium]
MSVNGVDSELELLRDTTGGASVEALAREHPADVAEVIQTMPALEGAQVLTALSPEAAADALGQMREEHAEQYVAELALDVAASAVHEMAPDDAADLLAELPQAHRDQILAGLDVEDRVQLETLMAYPSTSAGGIMSPDVTALSQDLTVPEAIGALRRIADESEQLYYTYVVDNDNRLAGVLSLHNLLFARGTQRLRDIMITSLVTVPADMNREEVATLFTKYGYLALPVVDADNRLLGIVTVDDVVGVIQDEATEDMHRMVGAGADEHVGSPVRFVLRRRIPWLLVNLGTAFLASSVVGAFESTLQQMTALAVLLPIVAGQAGNTGLQSMAVMIRGIATGETRGRRLTQMLSREVGIGLGTGVLIGLACALVCLFWRGDPWLAAAIGAAMVACMLMATVSGALVPWCMKRLGFDPAQSASIILTTITDVAGFGIFLALGTLLVSMRH